MDNESTNPYIYTFNINIEKLNSFLTTKIHLNNIMNILFEKSLPLKENPISYNIKYKSNEYLITLNTILNKEEIKTFSLKISNNVHNLNSFLKIYADTSNDTSLLILNILNYSDKTVYNKDDFVKMCSEIEMYINSHSLYMNVSNSNILNTNYEQVWRLLLSYDEFLKAVPNMAVNVEYDKVGYGYGSVLKTHLPYNIWIVYKVIKCEIKYNKGIYMLKKIDSSLSTPNQIIIFTTFAVSRSKCVLNITHLYDNVMPNLNYYSEIPDDDILYKIIDNKLFMRFRDGAYMTFTSLLHS